MPSCMTGLMPGLNDPESQRIIGDRMVRKGRKLKAMGYRNFRVEVHDQWMSARIPRLGRVSAAHQVILSCEHPHTHDQKVVIMNMQE